MTRENSGEDQQAHCYRMHFGKFVDSLQAIRYLNERLINYVRGLRTPR